MIILSLTVLIFFFSFQIIRDNYIEITTSNLKNITRSLMPEVFLFIKNKQLDELDLFVKNMGKSINARITVVSKNGAVLADSQENPVNMENHKERPEIAGALTGSTGKDLRFSNTVKKDMLYVALPVEYNNEVYGALRTSVFLKDINSLLYILKIKIAQIVAIILILSIIAAALLVRGFSKPVQELSAASKKLAEGDFDVRVLLKNKDELKDLADSFNYMASRIKNLFKEVSGQKEELNGIISSIQELLVVLDYKGRIILSNDSFKKYVNNMDMRDKFYWEIPGMAGLEEIVEKVSSLNESASGEIKINEDIFICTVAPSKYKEKKTVILHNITEVKRLEKLKKDFISNVSHEMRTPLTAIKGFAQTLEDSADQESRRFADIINKHADRLMNIVQDLLLLSELEEKGSKLEVEEVDLEKLAKGIINIFDFKAKEKNINLNLVSDQKIPGIKLDPFKIEQVFINLIDNAVKYTESGDIKIILKNEGPSVRVEVQDTGIGIPAEHIPRIFERFYVADKSRSRKIGGTGLGLSIVKHIVLLHGGNINVESMPGCGTKFIIYLPLN
ncbi:MAG: ATP-binding protein [Armatimonadota bacterium]